MKASTSWPGWQGLAGCLGSWGCWGIPWVGWEMPGTFPNTGTASGKDQGTGMKAHTEVSHSFSQFSCFHSLWSRITSALHQGSRKGRADRVWWWPKGCCGLYEDIWVIEKQKSEGCMRGVLKAPRLTGHRDPNPAIGVWDTATKKMKVSQKKKASLHPWRDIMRS